MPFLKEEVLRLEIATKPNGFTKSIPENISGANFISLKRFESDDLGLLEKLLRDEAARIFLPWARDIHTPEDMKQRIKFFMAENESGRCGRLSF